MNRTVRTRTLAAAGVVLTAAGLAVVATAGPAGAAVTCRTGTSIGVQGPLSGANRAFGIAALRGATLAVHRHNRSQPGCVVRVVRADSQGDPSRAPGAATALLRNKNVVGVVGPVFSGEAHATGAQYARAKLVTITPSATNPELSTHRWATFVRGTGNDNATAANGARLLTTTLKLRRICVVADDTDYGRITARAVSRHLGARKVCGATIRSAKPDYRAAARAVLAEHATGVYFAGYDVFAGRTLRQLRASGYDGRFVTDDGAYSSAFVKQAGPAARGAYVVSGIAPRTLSPTLARAYRSTYRAAIPTYATEAYDAANVLLAALDHGATTRSAVLTRVHAATVRGIAQTYRFTRTGELVHPNSFAYVVRSGAFAFVRRVS